MGNQCLALLLQEFNEFGFLGNQGVNAGSFAVKMI